MSQPIFIYVTVPTKEVALSIAQTLLEKKLITCANIFPITTVYHWEGQVNQGDEQVVLLKTFDHLYQVIQQEIQQIHPYRIPAIIKFSVELNAAFLAWMQEALVR